MVTLLIAAAVGWLAGYRAAMIGWILAAGTVGAMCVIVAIAGWSWQSLVEAAVSLIAFSLTLLLGTLQRRRASRLAAELQPEAKSVR